MKKILENNFELIIIFIICVTLYIMSDKTWSTLPKSGDNPETIEEAIARMIEDHNNNSVSHMGPGQSIDEHRKESIIDHPAASIVSDKLGEADYYEYQGELPAYNWSVEDGAADLVQGRNLNFSLFSQTYFLALNNLSWKRGADYPERDLMIKFVLEQNGTQNADGYWQLTFGNDDQDAEDSIRIFKQGTGTKLIFLEGGDIKKSKDITMSVITDIFFRIYYEYVSQTIKVYQGSTLIETYEPEDWENFIFDQMWLEGYRSTNTSIGLKLKHWQCSYSLKIDV